MNTTLTPFPRPKGRRSLQTYDQTPMAVGIDINHGGDLARLVYGDPQGNLYVLGWRAFRDVRRFGDYWKTHLEQSPRPPSSFLVGIPRYTFDQIGIVRWLEARGITVYRTPLAGHDAGERRMWGLPETFGSAFELCQSMAYRHNAQDILADTWFQLTSLTTSLQRVSENLGNLAGAQAASPREPSGTPTFLN